MVWLERLEDPDDFTVLPGAATLLLMGEVKSTREWGEHLLTERHNRKWMIQMYAPIKSKNQHNQEYS